MSHRLDAGNDNPNRPLHEIELTEAVRIPGTRHCLAPLADGTERRLRLRRQQSEVRGRKHFLVETTRPVFGGGICRLNGVKLTSVSS